MILVHLSRCCLREPCSDLAARGEKDGNRFLVAAYQDRIQSIACVGGIDFLCGRYRFSLMFIEFWRGEGRWWDDGECWEPTLIVHFKRRTSLSCLRLVERLIDFSPIPIDIASIGIDYDQFSPSYAWAPALFSLFVLSHHESVVRSVTISITFLRFECAEYDISPGRSRSILLRFPMISWTMCEPFHREDRKRGNPRGTGDWTKLLRRILETRQPSFEWIGNLIPIVL